MGISKIVSANMQALRESTYPGRGIVIGLTPDATRMVQVYWIMGRSANSRNRLFVAEGDTIRTKAHEESKLQDPSLVIYNCVRCLAQCHIVSNGDQTDTLFDAILAGGTFEEALFTRTFEPDGPNFTPRISGVVDLDDECHAYKLAILKTVENNAEHAVRHFFNYQTGIPGVGHCVTTYSGDGNPLPAFEGEPRAVEILDGIDATADLYWHALNADNKVSLLVKTIDVETGETDLRIVNKHA